MGKRYVRITSTDGHFFKRGEVVQLVGDSFYMDDYREVELYEADNGTMIQAIRTTDFEEMRGDK